MTKIDPQHRDTSERRQVCSMGDKRLIQYLFLSFAASLLPGMMALDFGAFLVSVLMTLPIAIASLILCVNFTKIPVSVKAAMITCLCFSMYILLHVFTEKHDMLLSRIKCPPQTAGSTTLSPSVFVDKSSPQNKMPRNQILERL